MNTEHAKQLVVLFLAHKLHVDEVCETPDEPSKAMMHLCADVINSLKLFSVEEIIEIVKTSHVPFLIEKADIPQFSDFSLSVYKTPYYAYASGYKNIPFKDMGYMLLQGVRKDVAYKKYGENQAKTASMIGLCNITKGKINISYLGRYFCSLQDEEQKSILPKLLIYVPIIQNYLVAGRSSELIDSYLNILAETTKKRRIGNLYTMIQIVEKEMK